MVTLFLFLCVQTQIVQTFLNMEQKKIPLRDVVLNEHNPRQITDEKFNKLVESILVFHKMLELRPVVLDDNSIALGGNMRTRALNWIAKATEKQIIERLQRQLKFKQETEYEQQAIIAYWMEWKKKPVVDVCYASDLSEDERKEFVIKDNIGFGDWDSDILANEWDAELLDDWGLDVWQEDDEDSGAGDGGNNNGSLQDKFVVPPFSILDTRQGYWKARKKTWREMIGDVGESRENTLDSETGIMSTMNNGVSLFDPVLAEALCKWFTPNAGAKIYDCFAGDTQKGLVFGMCGFEFTGIELRQEQIDVNNAVLSRFDELSVSVKYICDDGQNVLNHIAKDTQDLLFSCPPYYDLEVYSDKPNDASNQPTYEGFINILDNAYTSALQCLKDNRFAVIVVGDVRDKKGFYYDFTGDIKRIFARNGVSLYNELIIVEPIGTLPQRVSRYMINRKIGKCHQNVLVFFKGNPADIKDTFPAIEYESKDIEEFSDSDIEE